MIYQWRPEARVKIDAQAAGEELERIRVCGNGRLVAAQVVDASRPDDAPLHDHFEWDDQQAAEQFRIDQARYLIRSITVSVETPEQVSQVRAFVSVIRDEDRSYTSIAHALSDEDLRTQVLQKAWAELEAWRKRYAELIELADMFSAIDQARAA